MSLFSQFTSPQKLRDRGIMGMNKRNHSYIGRYNDRSRYPLVDDKLKTKFIAQQAGATVPDLIGVIDSQATVKHIHHMVKDWPGFVIKPAQGSGGKGILVIVKHKDGVYVKPLALKSINKMLNATLPTLWRDCSRLGVKMMLPWSRT